VTFLYCFSDSRDGCLRGKLSTRVVKMITEFYQYLTEARQRSLLMFSDSLWLQHAVTIFKWSIL